MSKKNDCARLLTVKKGLKAGAYTVKVTAAGNGTYNKASKTVTCTIVVK